MASVEQSGFQEDAAMTQDQSDQIGEMLSDIHTLIQQAEQKLYALESIIVEAMRERNTDT